MGDFRPRFRYIGCCVQLDGDAINAMKDGASELCLSSFTRAVDAQDWRAIKSDLGYSRLFRIETDWHVSFARSSYKGKPCVFITHSAIEYVFAEGRA